MNSMEYSLSYVMERDIERLSQDVANLTMLVNVLKEIASDQDRAIAELKEQIELLQATTELRL